MNRCLVVGMLSLIGLLYSDKVYAQDATPSATPQAIVTLQPSPTPKSKDTPPIENRLTLEQRIPEEMDKNTVEDILADTAIKYFKAEEWEDTIKSLKKPAVIFVNNQREEGDYAKYVAIAVKELTIIYSKDNIEFLSVRNEPTLSKFGLNIAGNAVIICSPYDFTKGETEDKNDGTPKQIAMRKGGPVFEDRIDSYLRGNPLLKDGVKTGSPGLIGLIQSNLMTPEKEGNSEYVWRVSKQNSFIKIYLRKPIGKQD